MTQAHFNHQMGRMYSLFGEKSFANERLKIIWSIVEDLQDHSFTRIVNHMVSNFRQPPLPKDFREAAIGERNSHADLRSVPDIMKPNFKGDGGLQRFMARDYPGCTTLWQAVEVQVLKNKFDRINNGEVS